MEGRQPALGVLGRDVGMTRARRLGLVLVAVLALSSCSSSSDDDDGGGSGEDGVSAPAATSSSAAPTPTATPTPPPPVPAAGGCYRLSYAEALAPTAPDAPVDCAGAHTSQTFAVGRLDLVAGGHLLAVDSRSVRRQVARRCPPGLAAYLGATPEQLRLSLLRPVWFTPSLEESDLGADWYRCDVIAVTGDRTVAKFSGDLAGAFRRPARREEFAMCGTAQPGTAEFSRVLCRDEHSWRAITVVDLADAARQGRYPGVEVVREAGQDLCADAALQLASDPLDYEWGYEWPTKDQWAAGQTYGRCWSPDPA